MGQVVIHVDASVTVAGDGTVGILDLQTLLANWGPCKGCSADFDGNGTVGASDLLALLTAWGPCP